MPTLFESVVSAVTLFVGATVLSTIGFGIGMTTIPVLLVRVGAADGHSGGEQHFPRPVRDDRLSEQGRVASQKRRDPGLSRDWWAFRFGVLILKDSDAGLLKIAITALTIILTLVVAFNVRARIPSGLLAGLVVAFVVSVTLNALGIGGPIMALYMLTQNWSRNAVRGALSLYFLFVEAAGVVGYGIAGLLTTERIALILIAVVPVTLGFLLATYLVRRMNDVVFRRATVVAIIGMSGLVLAREIAAL